MNHIYYPVEKDIMAYHNDYEIFSKEARNKYHRHNACEIYIFKGNKGKFYVEHTCYALTRGSLIIISPEELHRSDCLNDENYESLGVNIKTSVLSELSTPSTNLFNCFLNRRAGENNLTVLSETQLTFCTDCICEIKSLSEHKPFGFEILAKAQAARLLVLINSLFELSPDSFTAKNGMPKIVCDTICYIKGNLTENLSLHNLQIALNYNGTYISTTFRHHTGLTLREYILDQRIQLAKSLLTDGASVQTACNQAGFNDYSNFIRTFTKITGISPGRYQQKKQQTDS